MNLILWLFFVSFCLLLLFSTEPLDYGAYTHSSTKSLYLSRTVTDVRCFHVYHHDLLVEISMGHESYRLVQTSSRGDLMDFIYSHTSPFQWAVNLDHTLLILYVDSKNNHPQDDSIPKIILFRKRDGIWYRVRDYAVHIESPVTLSVGTHHIIISHKRGLLTLSRTNQYELKSSIMSRVQIDFRMDALSLCENTDCFVVATPYFKQTDGIVDVYHYSGNLESLEHVQALLPPVRAGYFGGQYSVIQRGHKTVLVVSAFFANQGVGEVFLYELEDCGTFSLQQRLTSRNTTNFGLSCSVSSDGVWLAISDRSTLYIYNYRDGAYHFIYATSEGGSPLSMSATGTLYWIRNHTLLYRSIQTS